MKNFKGLARKMVELYYILLCLQVIIQSKLELKLSSTWVWTITFVLIFIVLHSKVLRNSIYAKIDICVIFLNLKKLIDGLENKLFILCVCILEGRFLFCNCFPSLAIESLKLTNSSTTGVGHCQLSLFWLLLDSYQYY